MINCRCKMLWILSTCTNAFVLSLLLAYVGPVNALYMAPFYQRSGVRVSVVNVVESLSSVDKLRCIGLCLQRSTYCVSAAYNEGKFPLRLFHCPCSPLVSLLFCFLVFIFYVFTAALSLLSNTTCKFLLFCFQSCLA